MSKHTPMMKQYLRIKAEHQDAFLFFRLGDFYEMFFEDAIKASQALEITLTKRDSGQKEPIPMCGVPHHSAENYIKTLVEQGYKVAVCEQVEDPKEAVGVVKREVVQLITPGTVMESSMLDDRKSNYIASLSHFQDGSYVIIYNDLSTGENSAIIFTTGWEAIIHELYNRSIKEIVISPDFPEQLQVQLQEKLHVTLSYQKEVDFTAEYRSLCDNINDERIMKAFSRLLNYIQHTQKRSLDHLKPAEVIELKDYLSLDMYSKRNLELTESIMQKGKHGSLLSVLDHTVTAMGARMLRKWIERPLLHLQLIEQRQNIVESFYKNFIERDQLRETLKSVYDLERLSGRIAFGNVNARDLIQLKQSLEKIPEVKLVLQQFSSSHLQELYERLTLPDHVLALLESSLIDNPPISIKDGSIIKDGFNEQLDTYRDASRNGKKWIAELERKEKEETGIKSLKIGYNRVFGYFIEITNANKHLIPEGKYERKQTLANAERYITPELKEKEQLILEAEEKSVELEYNLFIQIREQMKEHIPHFQQLAATISKIDVLQSFAAVSETNDYIRPTFDSQELHIKKGRHPVVEQVMSDGEFVPNDIVLNEEKNMLLITGPNMSGKSTYMRQLAHTVIMAQIGCFVPAEKAKLLLFDQIFTRIGAADDLVAGQSTFMVEMLEANHAISHATNQSLILLDEIGRGTSTYDGMALAQAIIEHIHDHVGAKTLFSTHYHELTTLEESMKRLKNVHVRAEEFEGNVVFLHQIEEGAADESYGIHVAKLADLPQSLIDRANKILTQLENTEKVSSSENNEADEAGQLTFFAPDPNEKDALPSGNKVIRELKKINLFDMTPLEAMNELNRLQKLARNKQS
ncbi:DNA mismatch repair protein MutS [Virgibacillus sp. W0181]|uniref:DNA mismatch repair protein MutS n=1 Tax=Virgibacillus sp. W0181 TaxID=3391581 RepID=UPI003F465333